MATNDLIADVDSFGGVFFHMEEGGGRGILIGGKRGRLTFWSLHLGGEALYSYILLGEHRGFGIDSPVQKKSKTKWRSQEEGGKGFIRSA